MKRPPAVFVVSGSVSEAFSRGCGLVTRGVRYYPHQPLYLLNPDTGDCQLTEVTCCFAGPLSSMTRDQLEPVGYRSRGAVLDLLESDLGSDIDLDAWVTILHWKL